MNKLYARSVFFVADAERALRHYVEQFGFAEDWNSDGVCQVSLLGFELILNEADERTRDRVGHGRLFIGLENDQAAAMRTHIQAHHIRTERIQWGQPTLVIKDLDENELFLWDWPDK